MSPMSSMEPPFAADPLAAVRSGLTRAHDLLASGDWAEAEAVLRDAAASLGDVGAARSFAPVARGGLTPNQVLRLRRHVDEHLGEPIRLSDLAAVAGLSRSHFCRMFHASFGEPPLAYVQRRRLERAKRLMLETDRLLAAIARECGLCDQGALTRLFRRAVGQSPAAWRRLNRG
jgi:AraC family transcriptional regulator